MDFILILGIVLILGALSCKTTGRVGMPVLVGFIFIGILIGNWYKFEDKNTATHLCNFALLLIIFCGGFQTDYSDVKPVLGVSAALSVAGTFLTALVLSLFAYYVLRLEFYQAALLGSVIASTDSASIFSVLRSKQIDLKNKLDTVLEAESSSNGPFAHMLTTVFLALALGSSQNILSLLLPQIIFGLLSGFVFAKLGQLFINRINLDIDGIYGAILCGVAFIIYGAAVQVGGNGFLAVYAGGAILGNVRLVYKGYLTKLFSAISILLQITLFIVLGMLCIPSAIGAVLGDALAFALFLFLIARPVLVWLLMKPFRRPLNEIALVSWAGFRGASSIVFAAMVLTAGLPYSEYVFSVVFLVCMLSITIQGSLILPFAKKLKLIDDD